ncbi:pilus assembly protein PilY [Dyella nitratireducens]
MQYQPQRIGLRGYGNVNLTTLQTYNSQASESDVQATCLNGGTYRYGPAYYTYTYSYLTNNAYTNLVTTSYTYTKVSGHRSTCSNDQPAPTSTGGAGPLTGSQILLSAGTQLYQQNQSVSSQKFTPTPSTYTDPNDGTVCSISGTVTTTTYSYATAGSTLASTTQAQNDNYTGTGTPFALISGSYYPVSVTPTTTNTNVATIPDYPAIPNAYINLPSTTPIANENALTRATATPIAYKLQITQTGLLSLWYSYNGGNYVPVLTSQDISSSNGAMPANFLFGFGGSTGGSQNVHEITCFQATPANVSASSAGINTQQTGQVQTGTQVYLAYYHPNNWWGELDSQNLVYNATTGTVSISSAANWDASCVLTGGSCTATGQTGMTAQGTGSRNMVTWTGGPNDNASSAGAAPFSWGRLTTNEQSWLGSNDSGVTNASQVAQDRVAYLGGDRTNEVTQSGKSVVNAAGSYDNFRARTSVLGDIIDSSPVWVGPPLSPYPNTWSDLLYPTQTMAENATGAITYGTFAGGGTNGEAKRLNVVYVGSNDGFMHGFESGYYNTDGTYACASQNTNGIYNLCANGTANDGKEVLAYIPGAVLSTIHNAATSTLDYSSVNYAHNFYMDATPGTGDLFYGNAWHTWLVSGLGVGGNAIFALDITDLGTNAFGTGSVIGEWSTAVTGSSVATTLVCKTDTSSSVCGKSLGQTVGTPEIRRLHNGGWAIIFGNGFNSVTGHAGIYVMLINGNGAISASSQTSSTVYFLDTGVGSASNPNGIGYVSAVDLDGDHIADYVYAGDAYGNIWRFDLTSSNPANWGVSSYGNSSATPLFTTPPIKTVYTTTTTTSGGTTTTTTSTPTITVLSPVAPSQQSTYAYGTTSTTSGNTTTYTVISPQPITTQLVVVATTEPSSSSNTPYVLVEFGTGSIQPQSVTSSATYSGGPQTLYGIWDWGMGVAGTAGAGYAGLSVGSTGTPTASSPITQSNLEQQTITSTTTSSSSTSTILGYRTVSENTVCMEGSTCATTNSSGNLVNVAGSQFGWYLNLPAYNGVSWVGGSNQTEQVIYSPIESEGAFIVNTTIPANNSPLSCTVVTTAGWTMALNPATGGGFTNSFFSDTTGVVISGSISGIALSAVGSPSVVTAKGQPYLVNQTVSGVGTVNQINPPGGQTGQRLTWLQLR